MRIDEVGRWPSTGDRVEHPDHGKGKIVTSNGAGSTIIHRVKYKHGDEYHDTNDLIGPAVVGHNPVWSVYVKESASDEVMTYHCNKCDKYHNSNEKMYTAHAQHQGAAPSLVKHTQKKSFDEIAEILRHGSIEDLFMLAEDFLGESQVFVCKNPKCKVIKLGGVPRAGFGVEKEFKNWDPVGNQKTPGCMSCNKEMHLKDDKVSEETVVAHEAHTDYGTGDVRIKKGSKFTVANRTGDILTLKPHSKRWYSDEYIYSHAKHFKVDESLVENYHVVHTKSGDKVAGPFTTAADAHAEKMGYEDASDLHLVNHKGERVNKYGETRNPSYWKTYVEQ